MTVEIFHPKAPAIFYFITCLLSCFNLCNADIYSILNLTTDGINKINANYNYCYDKTNNFSHAYKFHNNSKKFKEVRLNHNIISNVVNDKFNIQGINSTRINLLIYLVNNNRDNKSIELFDYNTVQVIYNDNIDTLKSDKNKNNISSNLEIINTIKVIFHLI